MLAPTCCRTVSHMSLCASTSHGAQPEQHRAVCRLAGHLAHHDANHLAPMLHCLLAVCDPDAWPDTIELQLPSSQPPGASTAVQLQAGHAQASAEIASNKRSAAAAFEDEVTTRPGKVPKHQEVAQQHAAACTDAASLPDQNHNALRNCAGHGQQQAQESAAAGGAGAPHAPCVHAAPDVSPSAQPQPEPQAGKMQRSICANCAVVLVLQALQRLAELHPALVAELAPAVKQGRKGFKKVQVGPLREFVNSSKSAQPSGTGNVASGGDGRRFMGPIGAEGMRETASGRLLQAMRLMAEQGATPGAFEAFGVLHLLASANARQAFAAKWQALYRAVHDVAAQVHEGGQP